jgi:hypothetical protein
MIFVAFLVASEFLLPLNRNFFILPIIKMAIHPFFCSAWLALFFSILVNLIAQQKRPIFVVQKDEIKIQSDQSIKLAEQTENTLILIESKLMGDLILYE